MLILADSFGVQRTSEELLEFLEVSDHESHKFKAQTRERVSVRVSVYCHMRVRLVPTRYVAYSQQRRLSWQ